ncbi:DUF6308 family protein [Brachybacterium paraconglomeratum]
MPKFAIPEILHEDRVCEASQRINYYYTELTTKGRKLYSGSLFDEFASDQNPGGAFTSADFLSTGLLGVHVPGEAIVKFFSDAELMKELERLLEQLPANVDLGDLNKPAFNRLLGSKGSPGFMLWDLIRGHRVRGMNGKEYVGMGETLTSKLLARKRPRLIPIWDRRVGNQIKLPHSGDHWEGMWRALTDEDGKLTRRLTEIRKASRQRQISLLRTFDVAVWHFDKNDEWSQPSMSKRSEPADDDGLIGDAADAVDGVPDVKPVQK